MNCYHYVGNLHMVLAVVGTAEAIAQGRNAARHYVYTHALTQLPAMCTCPQKLVCDIRRPSKIFYLFVNIYVLCPRKYQSRGRKYEYVKNPTCCNVRDDIIPLFYCLALE